ncbi:MAG: MmcQ/YjbR family DNA-binding protein [Hyphomonadaceae bacterium]|jgi:hypothetical protein|nr:MmcQ/YjbR family DNA-binding protein [Hyphomonadaceae bacterium]
MTPAAFLKLALALPDVDEGQHQGGADLRVAGKIFASPAVRAGGAAYLKLTPEQQQMLCAAEPEAFAPVVGGWGLKGATWFYPKHADVSTAKGALWMAWRNAAPKSLLKAHADRIVHT